MQSKTESLKVFFLGVAASALVIFATQGMVPGSNNQAHATNNGAAGPFIAVTTACIWWIPKSKPSWCTKPPAARADSIWLQGAHSNWTASSCANASCLTYPRGMTSTTSKRKWRSPIDRDARRRNNTTQMEASGGEESLPLVFFVRQKA